ncbi:MAG TPA: hypothetical protein VF950_03515 [Planctomycetota bacterium]
MAKRKLSSEQRAELRAELKKAIGSGQKTADVLRDVAKKYGITTITARWYLKSIGGAPRKARGGAKRGRKPGRPSGDGDLLKLVEEQARSAKEARKLVPRWQRLVTREASLRQLAARVQRKLDTTSRKAVALRKRIDVLVGS